jgi:NADH/NAD ratio-sensing transcriptional regulator Rex
MAAKALYQKIYDVLSQSSQKYVTAEMLSQWIGIYPDVINEALSLFNPVVTLDVSFNLLELLPDIGQHLGNEKPIRVKKVKPSRAPLAYGSFAEFVYQKMTIAGIVDKNIVLSEKDLKLAKKLIQVELKSRKK